jgi:glycosyltransferase involved in cell wall biosynthesis
MQPRIRLLHIVGSEMALRPYFTGQARYMTEHGIDVTLCSPPTDDAYRFAVEERARFFPCDMERSIGPWQDVKSIAHLSRYLRKSRPHIVHAHGPKASLIGLTAACGARTPVRIGHVHGLPFLSDTQPQKLLRMTMRATCALTHRVLCVSKSAAGELVAAGCCPPHKVTTLLAGGINGIDATGRFNPGHFSASVRHRIRGELGIPAAAFVVGFVGRVVADKGIAELLTAFNQLRKLESNLHLLMAGPWESRNAIPEVCRQQLASDPQIHWAGEDRDTPRLYAAMDVLALPSYREGLGLVLLEANAMGLPVVASRIPGCVDAVQDGVTGTLVPPRDANALAAAIQNYCQTPELRWRHGAAGRARVLAEFRPLDMWEAVYNEYAQLLKRRGVRLAEVSGTTSRRRAA